jgi:hypothetical protein
MDLKNSGSFPSFAEIRANNLFYSDKTKFIYRLIREPKVKILCRPRGFGKTLLLDTLAALFQGRRELFRGLWIDSSDFSFAPHPVVRLDLDYPGPLTPQLLRELVTRDLEKIAQAENLSIGPLNPTVPLTDLLVSLFRKYNPQADENSSRPVRTVFLADNFDAPVLANLDNPKLARGLQETLDSLFRPLANLTKFCGLTVLAGETTLGWSGRALPADLIEDISFDPSYAGFLGLTEDDLDRILDEQGEELTEVLIRKNQLKPGSAVQDLKEAVLYWYDGYVFDIRTPFEEKTKDRVVRVLNPYSIGRFLAGQSLGNYWLHSRNSRFLAQVISRQPVRFLESDFSGYAQLSLTHLEHPSVGLLLFQTGYLTVRETASSHGFLNYSLKVPNTEVSLGFRNTFLDVLFNLTSSEEIKDTQRRVKRAFSSRNPQELEDVFELAVARLVYRPAWPSDYFYRLVFQWFIYSLGLDTEEPDQTENFNRAELVADFQDSDFRQAAALS